MRKIEGLIRPELLNLKPYSSARDEFQGQAEVYIDANENPFGSEVNRYPDPLQRSLKEKLSEIKGVPTQNIFLGNGSDEVLDLIVRLFCVPGKDEIMITPPTYGMYKVLADVNNIFVKEVPLDRDFQILSDVILKRYDRETKVLFLCSPNNPVGISLRRDDVIQILENWPGIVVIDEAYIDFSKEASYCELINEYGNLIVTQTLSKAWGMAGIRLGMAITNEYIVSQLNKIKPPYNVNVLTQNAAEKGLNNLQDFKVNLATILAERERLRKALIELPMISKIHESDANFLLCKFNDADRYYEMLRQEGVIVRNRSKQPGCAGCLRITIGTPVENNRLLEILVK